MLPPPLTTINHQPSEENSFITPPPIEGSDDGLLRGRGKRRDGNIQRGTCNFLHRRYYIFGCVERGTHPFFPHFSFSHPACKIESFAANGVDDKEEANPLPPLLQCSPLGNFPPPEQIEIGLKTQKISSLRSLLLILPPRDGGGGGREEKKLFLLACLPEREQERLLH